jgi:hypothetical protein
MRGDHVVDIGGIAAHHCINIAFIMPMPHILGRNMEGLFGDLWLSHAFYHNNLEGLKLFLDVILNLRDVYVVSIRQVMLLLSS